MRKIIYILLFISAFIKAGTPSIIFKENKGQWPEKVLFGTEILNTKFYINKNGFNYCVYKPEEYIQMFGKHRPDEKRPVVHGHNYEVEFVGASLANITKVNEQPEYYNYFLGKDRKKWASEVKAYTATEFKDVYSGINLKVYSNGLNLKYDFIVKPNSDPSKIKLNFKQIDGLELRNGELIIKTSVGEMVEKLPVVYQLINGKKKFIECNYIINRETVSFSFPKGYNKNYELVIDPTVVVCSYSGASSYAFGDACTYDANGNIYVGAEAEVGYPTTVGAFQMNGHPDTAATSGNTIYDVDDIVISAYSSNGSTKFFSTYIGGGDMDYPLDIIVKNNEITVLGGTSSVDFPCTINGFDTTYNYSMVNGYDYDLSISKLNMSGTTLLASTYVGGTKSELTQYNSTSLNFGWNAAQFECDVFGNVYVIGGTNSVDFPVTPSVISTTIKGITDAFVFKINNTLSNLIWSTYLGGSSTEGGASIKLDGKGGVYCFGNTSSLNFPVTAGAYNMVKNGSAGSTDLYITHIDSLGKTILASTFLGTTGQEDAYIMALDRMNDVYLVGCHSAPSLFTATPGTYSNPNGYNFIYKLNSSLSALSFKTKFGFPPPPTLPQPSPYLGYSALKVDSCEKIYIGGWGENYFPTTPNALQPFGGGPTDLYIAQFNQNCSSLAFASYFGGAATNSLIGTCSNCIGEMTGTADFDNRGNFYSAIGIPGGLPTTPNAYAMTWVSTSTFVPANDAFVKIDLQTFINAGSSYGANITGCPPFTPTFVSTTNTGSTYWNLGNGVSSTQNSVTTTYTNLGTYNVLLVVTDTNTCNRYDSIKSILNVINPTVFDLGDDIPTCLNSPTILEANVSAVTYSWSTGQTTPSISVNQIGTYTLTINNGGCNSSDEINVVIGEKKLSERFPNVITPNGDNINDFIDFIKFNFDEVEFYVFDRWGRERYKITKPDEKWNPSDLNNGTYYYVANYKSSCTGKYATDKGFISVFK
jgi:gliding motility-associated-like protein